MELNIVCNWLEQLKNNWLKKDLENIVKLFTKDCECYDTPFSEKGNVYNDWQEIKSQKINDISYQILLTNGLEFIVEFKIKYENELCSAINHIKLNKDIKCFYLKQWYMSK